MVFITLLDLLPVCALLEPADLIEAAEVIDPAKTKGLEGVREIGA